LKIALAEATGKNETHFLEKCPEEAYMLTRYRLTMTLLVSTILLFVVFTLMPLWVHFCCEEKMTKDLLAVREY
jgi:hypothetical protein